VKELFFALGGSPALVDAVAFPVYDPERSIPPPRGFSDLDEAIARGLTVQIEYAGGSRGASPRAITPKRFLHRGGTVYLLAFCHIDQFDKQFRLDRMIRREIALG